MFLQADAAGEGGCPGTAESGLCKGAAARGVDERTILFSHVLKNALVPILTWCSIYFGVMLGGAAVIETIFSWDGIGKLAIESVSRLDYFMIQGFVLWVAVIFLLVNFVVDLLSAVIDPRIKGERDEKKREKQAVSRFFFMR